MAIATSKLRINYRSRRPRLTSTSRTWWINFRLTIGPMRSPSRFGEVCCRSDHASLLKNYGCWSWILLLGRKWRIRCEPGPPVEKSSKRTQGFYGAKMPSKGYLFENVAPFVYCNDTGRLPPVRAGAGDPELPSTWLDTAVRATRDGGIIAKVHT